MIELVNVVKEYDNGTLALDGVDLKIENGEFVFLVGIPEIGGRERLEKIAPVTVLMNI